MLARSRLDARVSGTRSLLETRVLDPGTEVGVALAAARRGIAIINARMQPARMCLAMVGSFRLFRVRAQGSVDLPFTSACHGRCNAASAATPTPRRPPAETRTRRRERRSGTPGRRGAGGAHDSFGVGRDESEGVAALVVLGELLRGAMNGAEFAECLGQRPRL